MAVDVAAAVQLAQDFARLYGTFSPANLPTPGQVWVSSWQAWASDLVISQARQDYDRLWGWTWDQQVQCHDVTVTGPVTSTTKFGTVVVTVPAKRYVLAVAASRADAGVWQELTFRITVGPRTVPGSAGSRGLSVYLVSMTVTGQG